MMLWLNKLDFYIALSFNLITELEKVFISNTQVFSEQSTLLCERTIPVVYISVRIIVFKKFDSSVTY